MDMPKNRLIEREFLLGGIAAGLIGGVLMALLEMGISYFKGSGLFAPLALIDSVARGTSTVSTEHPADAVYGLLIHLLISALVGGTFAIGLRLMRRLSGMIDAVWAGLAFGVIVWGAARNLVLLPYGHPTGSSPLDTSPEIWFLGHVIYGASLGLTPVIAKWFYRGEEWEEEEERRGLAA